jgi:tripartite-type tricarboxylate transporter receptor subunit TctC
MIWHAARWLGMRRLGIVAGLAATVICALAFGPAGAQTYPDRPIKLVVPFGAGGPPDVAARIIADYLSAQLGTIFIDNRPGAGGTIGARAAADADPDGYSLLLANTSTLIVGPLIYKNVAYDAVKSFAPVALLGTTSNLLIVNPALRVNSVQQLIALARAQPGKLNFSSAGIGTPPHLIGEMFRQRLGLDVVHVPYKGAAARRCRRWWPARPSSRSRIRPRPWRSPRPARCGLWRPPARGAAPSFPTCRP